MLDNFCEYLIKRKKGTNDIVRIALYVVLGLMLTFLLMTYGLSLAYTYAPYLTSLLLPLVALVWYGVYRLITKLNIEFEYALTDGQLDIDRIENKNKRKRLLRNISIKGAALLAPVTDGEYNEHYRSLKTVDATANESTDNVYFLVFENEGQDQCLLFEPNARMLEAMYRLNPSKFHINKVIG